MKFQRGECRAVVYVKPWLTFPVHSAPPRASFLFFCLSALMALLCWHTISPSSRISIGPMQMRWVRGAVFLCVLTGSPAECRPPCEGKEGIREGTASQFLLSWVWPKTISNKERSCVPRATALLSCCTLSHCGRHNVEWFTCADAQPLRGERLLLSVLVTFKTQLLRSPALKHSWMTCCYSILSLLWIFFIITFF